MEMPKPNEFHEKLHAFVGEWTGEEKIFPSPWDPHGGPANGYVQNVLGLDGFAVIQEYRQERNGVINFRGHAVIVWDPAEKSYILYWFDSAGMPATLMRGSCEGNVFTFFTAGAHGHSRATFDFSGDGTYLYVMEVSPDGQQWSTFMEGVYKKK